MTTDPAVTAAAEAMRANLGSYTFDTLAEDAVAAARPIIEAEVRERIAVLLEDTDPCTDDCCTEHHAAAVVRGQW